MRIALLLLALLWPTLNHAQQMSPRAYWPAPTGTQVLTVGASYVSGDIVPDPSLPVSGFDSDITTAFVGYLRTLDLFGRSANLIFELPYIDGETKAVHDELGFIGRDYSGVGDASVTLSYNLRGAPAMDPKEFMELRSNPRPIIGVSLKVVAPTGDYDENRVVNVGSNRWATRIEIGSMFVLRPKWLLEVAAGVWVFEDNDDFLGFNKEQSEIYAVETHLVHRFRPGFWASLDLNAYKGGRSKVGDRRLNDLQRDTKVGATVVFPFAHKQAFKFSYHYGSVNDSDERFDVVTASYQRVF
jgi:outer membrane putative beta-barrel porin/alpha-amylase